MPYNISVSSNNAFTASYHGNELGSDSNALSYDQFSVRLNDIKFDVNNISYEFKNCIDNNNKILEEITKHTDENRLGDIKKSFDDLFGSIYDLRKKTFNNDHGEYKKFITREERDEYVIALVSLSQVVDAFTNKVNSMEHNVASDIKEEIIGHLNGKGLVYQDYYWLIKGEAVPLLPGEDDDSDLECG